MPSALITRPEDQSAQLAARLREKSYTPVLAPLFTIRRKTLAPTPAVQAILVTSGNALAALSPADVPIYVVGDATAARARAAGFVTIHSAGADASALSRLVAGTLRPEAGPLLLAAGAGQGGALAAGLRAQGFRVRRRVCYEAVPVQTFPAAAAAAIAARELSAAIFLSAETAAIFVRLLPPDCIAGLARVSALAIGKTTADVLGVLPWLRICLARTPTLDEVLAFL